MVFTSPEYIIFFVICVGLYFFIPYRLRWIWLLVAGYLFYAYKQSQYLWVLLTVTLVSYGAGRIFASVEGTRTRKITLGVSLVINFGLLFVFKYFNFFNATLESISAQLNIPYQIQALNLILPLGISFYIFQSSAYVIDVYKGKVGAEKHAGIFGAFVAFFPLLIAGPIERANHLLPQFHVRQFFHSERTVEGFRRILWGVFKKIVIADRLALYVNAVYNNATDYTGIPLILATFFFAFQLYCDFSAYSDIALGTAKVMGFDLIENFRQPYFATSIREFWNRWHISLSTWFRDYIYIPLGGSRVSLPRTLINVMIIFLVSGLWHGANWTFIVWGALHGLFICLETLWERLRPQAKPLFPAGIKIAFTFSLVLITWVFFRATTFEDAAHIFRYSLTLSGGEQLFTPFASAILPPIWEMIISFVLIGLLILVDLRSAKVGLNTLFSSMPTALRWGAYYACGFAVMFSGLYANGAQEFIYFNF